MRYHRWSLTISLPHLPFLSFETGSPMYPWVYVLWLKASLYPAILDFFGGLIRRASLLMGALASDSIPSVCATMPSRASVELWDPCWHYSQNMCKCNGFQSKSESSLDSSPAGFQWEPVWEKPRHEYVQDMFLRLSAPWHATKFWGSYGECMIAIPPCGRQRKEDLILHSKTWSQKPKNLRNRHTKFSQLHIYWHIKGPGSHTAMR